ncbi:MAG: RNA-binding protein [Desulfobacteraceae bacterium]|nr:RNA-binding protein [Desulfobacteraceae bacterium]
MNIFVGSLSFKTTEEQLQREFEAFGEVDSVKIIVDQATLKSRGFAFVTMPDRDQAIAAIAGMNGKEINGFTLKVNEARPREARPNRERPNSGFGGGERSSGGYSSGGGRTGGGGFSRDRNTIPTDSKGNTIYDTKGGRSGNYGKRGRGDGGRGPGGKSGGGRGRSY